MSDLGLSAVEPRAELFTEGRLSIHRGALLVSHASDDTYRTAIALLAYTGCRISEACALRWQDVDLVDEEITVAGQLTRATRTEPARIVPRKANGEPYQAILFPALSELLTAHLRRELAKGRGRVRALDADRATAATAQRRQGTRRGCDGGRTRQGGAA